MSIREHLLARVQPLVDRLASDLVAIIDEHIESRLARMTEAFDVALSAAASELGALDENAPIPARPVQSQRKAARPRSIVVDEIPAASVIVVHHGVKPENVIERIAPAETTPVAKVAKNGKAWPSCKLCGRVGVTARSHPHEGKPTSATRRDATPEASAPPLRGQNASRESRPQPVRAERPASDGDADPEGAAVAGELMPPREDVPTFVGPKRHRRRNPARPRKATISLKSMSIRAERAANASGVDAAELAQIAATRPRTRGECAGGPRPCPLVGCVANLYLDVSPLNGSITLNRPELEPWEMTESCMLDVADRGEHTLEQVGSFLNLTRERIRQVEISGLHKLKAAPVIVEAQR
jgi:hypothetical protein